MKLIASTYQKLQQRRTLVFGMLLALLIVSVIMLSRIKIEESIVAMLPDGQSRVAADFQLLQQAPFARKLVIHLRGGADVSIDQLLVATDTFKAALPDDLFTHVLSGPQGIDPAALVTGLDASLPLLLTADDLDSIAQHLTPEKIDQQMVTNLSQLLQPQGVALKEKIRRDPLDLQQLVLAKLRYLNPLPGVRIEQGHFISADGRSSLILADTPVPITDAQAGRRLVDAFLTARSHLPAGIHADLLSGHPYTLANAEVIQEDMQQVLLVSGCGILLLFLLLLRRVQALSVYLLPFVCIVVALVVTSLWVGRVSGITIGFGAVLLGITIDFGLHVYFALQHGSGSRSVLLQAVSRPVLFGGLTTLAAFSVLLFSELPGQRQLAIFAMAGIVTALFLALVVLPHFIGVGREKTDFESLIDLNRVFRQPSNLRWVVILLWLGVAVFSAVQAQKLSINGELRQLSYLPTSLQQAEQTLAEVWGRMRDRALIFTKAGTLEQVATQNNEIWRFLGQNQLQERAVSLASLLPARVEQEQRWQNWVAFWSTHRQQAVEQLNASGAKYGFSEAAFQPFIAGLERAPELIQRDSLARWGLGDLVNSLTLQDGADFQLITLIPDQPDLIEQLEPQLSKLPGVTLVSQGRFGRELSREIAADFANFILYAGVAVLLLLTLLFRRVNDILLALLPVLTGLLVMFGGMGWLGLEVNLFNVIATILIIGLGVDYGIFMVCQSRERAETASSRAILISGLTTLVGFGSLIMAQHPALHSIGVTVLLGISASVPTALLVIPALRPRGC